MEIKNFDWDIDKDEDVMQSNAKPLVSPVQYFRDQANNQDKNFDFKVLFKNYVLDYWYLYMVCIPLCLAIAYFYAKTIEPQYSITSKILIKDVSNEYGSQNDWLKKSLNFTSISENVSNDIQILSSFSLMRSVVDGLKLEIKYNWKDGLVNHEGYKDFPLVVDTFALSWEEFPFMAIDILPLDDESFQFMNDSLIGTYEFGELFTNLCGTFRINKREELSLPLDSISQIIFRNPDAVTESYQQRLSVRPLDEKSTIVEISLEEAVREKGVDVLNALIIEYAALKDEENDQTLNGTLSFLDSRLEEVHSNLRSLESSVERYKVENKVASESTSDLNIVLQKASGLITEQKELEFQVSILDQMAKSLNTSSDQFELISANVLTISTEIYDLVSSYNKLVLERKQLLNSAQLSNPIIQNSTERLTDLRNSIASAIAGKQEEIKIKLESITGQFAEATQHLKNIPTLERNLADKQRQKSIVENLYTYLLQKREEAALAEISSSQNFKVIDSPRSSLDPISPNRMLLYSGGLVSGFGLPIAIIFFMQLFRKSVKGTDEIRSILSNSAIMAMISQSKAKERHIMKLNSNTVLAENFRSLRANLEFDDRKKKQCILITSSTINEGKTFVASNLAISFALAGRRTIALDFDLRKPELSKYLDHSKPTEMPGVCSFLQDDLPIEEIIRHSEFSPNLDFIAGGAATNSSAELMQEDKLHELFSFLRERYDIIIIDTPPIGIISDAVLLSNYITKTLYIARCNYTEKAMLEFARDFFVQGKLINPSVIINGAKENNYYSYGHYYSNKS